jgi:hypothetical protein
MTKYIFVSSLTFVVCLPWYQMLCKGLGVAGLLVMMTSSVFGFA